MSLGTLVLALVTATLAVCWIGGLGLLARIGMAEGPVLRIRPRTPSTKREGTRTDNVTPIDAARSLRLRTGKAMRALPA